MFGPLPGAFVEPDEKSMAKKSDITQYSIFAAGPFSNILTGVLIAIILGLFFMQGNCNTLICDTWHPKGMSHSEGVYFGDIIEDSPAEKYDVQANSVYTKINDHDVRSANEFLAWFARVDPGERFILTDGEGNTLEIYAGVHPDNEAIGYLGVNNLQTSYVINNNSGWYVAIFDFLTWLAKVLFWIYLISLGLGLANLLPIGPVDGGRMLHTLMLTAVGEKKGLKIWAKVTHAGAVILIVLLLVPILKAVLGF